MNICIIGDGLTSLTLAKNLVNKKINVHIYQKNKIQKLLSSRTIGISQNNLEFFNEKIIKISQKNTWKINKIEVFSEKIKNENLLKFENIKDNLFYMVKNDNLYNLLKNEISKSIFFKKTIIKKTNFYGEFLKKNKFDLIINCELNNPISKKYFSKKIDKDYFNLAYTTILSHQKSHMHRQCRECVELTAPRLTAALQSVELAGCCFAAIREADASKTLPPEAPEPTATLAAQHKCTLGSTYFWQCQDGRRAALAS